MTTLSQHITASLITIACLLVSVSSFAQQKDSVTSDNLSLKHLQGYTQTIYYSEGHEARATNVAVFMENAGRYFQKELGFTPKTKLYILAPQDWKAVAVRPLHDVYGFPHNIDHERLVIAAENNAFWDSFIPDVTQLPAALEAKFTKAYAQPDGVYSMMPFFDLLALHEMGHSYMAQAGLKMHRYWMGELFVNIMLHTYVAEQQPELLPALEAFPDMVIGAGTANYTYTSLEDFESLYPTLGMGPQNYGWYQSQLHAAAKTIYDTGGKVVIQKLWQALLTHQDPMTDEAFVRMLKVEVHPSVADVYLKWLKAD